eukprot:CAMPEP_0175073806 /NCGR_PEP_ID=MMETSP0052_2-20121109/20828_1 /TAXON_ID=51329 ORGANISM="Polytomella parva, Strain SAG 63-3" /NCGR_SAMPLE_ID=MMETSP0052_2 /ASSEMBLY_ACC=CAM_ASM_000194 /LENGTH=457 /DNA_ID=CAMNT_0016341779 /DNA_START=141 /DNA_END=1511 /DNA_ORIENTATION=-
MPPKEGEKKKTPKQLLAASRLTAFQSIYKAAAKRYNVIPHKGLMEEIEAKLLLFKSVDKVIFQGPSVTSGDIRAIVESLAGYSAFKNLHILGCNIGDEGLIAIAALFKASGAETFAGSRIRQFELINDGVDFPPARWNERYVAMTTGAMASRGTEFHLPSLLFDEVESATLDTIRLQLPQRRERDPNFGIISSRGNISMHKDLADLTGTNSLIQHTSLSHQRLLEESESRIQTMDLDGRPKLRDPPPLAFSIPALELFSLSLGVQGQQLSMVALDHNWLGDAGIATLCAGLRRCSTLKQLSLSYCGISAVGTEALNSILIPAMTGSVALAAQRPELMFLNLSGNSLGGAGLRVLSSGLKASTSMRVILLADIDVAQREGDLGALSTLAEALDENRNITQVDLDRNLIGDQGVSVFFPFLTFQTHILKFRVTQRISRVVGAKLNELVCANLSKKKPGA